MDLKEITKEEAIAEFKKLCSEDFTKYQREESVGTNQNRNSWTLDLREIVASISDNEGVFKLLVYTASGDVYYSNRCVNVIGNFTISNEEYMDLKKHYFGEFTIHKYYMKQISRITAQYELIKNLELNENKVK